MTALNKQALREAAEKATPGEWKRMMRNSDELMTTFHGVAIGNVFVELTTGKRDIFDAEFIAAANPATVLALLDDLEAAEKRIAELEALEVVLPSVQDVHPLGPQSAKIFCEFHRNIVNRCADEIRKVGVKVSVKGE
ncbi:ead/Ea22-like family protein [Citrobacter freundii]|uniref:ead/Ea22-like family protein n=1 Tax=Citrobacter TaxID=544 RepID=UPI0020187085|nr:MULTISPECIES: ead/Ea22-like family protein [Citrobacter]MDM3259022.1 ead/Ea22-like family protein [Citrobacter sp. Cf062]MDQ9465275.1 ead/Ea22-like family protein [Citrobacter freundii]MEB1014916.1 ead/Ea22-like family protein [Citrobacter freundii]UQQ27159.1 ead/Ea22-like family protein [Citrobacter freundii]HDS5416983.1 ead/Ea22-like family protein [Citrobacter freundii]